MEGEAKWAPCGAGRPVLAPPINGTSSGCSRPQAQLQSSLQVQKFKFQVHSLKIHLVEVLLELERVRRIKSGSAIIIKRENKKE